MPMTMRRQAEGSQSAASEEVQINTSANSAYCVQRAHPLQLADYLRATPDSVTWIGSVTGHEDDIPEELLRLFNSPALLHVVNFDPNVRFTPTLVGACCGAGIDPANGSPSSGSA